MKRKVEDYVKEFKMPHLYLEDIKEIEGIILTELQPKNYIIESEEFEYGNLEELIKTVNRSNNKITDLEISLFDIPLHIHLSKNMAYIELWAAYINVKNLGIVTKISEIIEKRERKVLWFLSRFLVFFNFAFIITLWFLASNNVTPDNVNFIKGKFSPLFYPLTLLLTVYCAGNILGNIQLWNFSIVEFREKLNKENFFAKNKEQIILALISAIGGAVVLKIVEWLF